MSPVLEADREAAASEVVAKSWTRRSTALLLGLLLLSTAVIVRGIRKGEFSYNVDETQHAMTGFFVADLIRDHPLRHPVDYAYQYYAQYPALAGVIHWPPLFYLFEALSFMLLGPSVVSARLVILAFALAAITVWFVLVRETHDEWMAAASGLLLACAPGVILFEKSVMLEIPCLAFSLAATLFWIRYLLGRSAGDIYWFAIFASGAALTKQNAIYLIPFCILSGLSVEGWRMFVRPAVLRAAAIGVVLSAPFYCVVYLLHWKTVAVDLMEKSGSKVDAASFYWKALPDQMGWATFGLALLGVLTCREWGRPKMPAIMLSWIAACYLTFTLIGHKESRYALYWIPAFAYFAVGPLVGYFRKWQLRIAGRAAAFVLIGTSLGYAWTFQRPYVSGYQPVAEKVTEISKSGVVLLDGPLPGNFIFFLRANDAQRHFVVLRKALYATRLKPSGATIELVHSADEIQQLIHAYGIRFFVVSEGVPLKFDSQKMLREVLRTPSFRKVGNFPIVGSDLSPNLSLALYENTAWAPPTEKYLRVKMLTLDHDIVVPMDRFTVGDSPRPTGVTSR